MQISFTSSLKIINYDTNEPIEFENKAIRQFFEDKRNLAKWEKHLVQQGKPMTCDCFLMRRNLSAFIKAFRRLKEMLDAETATDEIIITRGVDRTPTSRSKSIWMTLVYGNKREQVVSRVSLFPDFDKSVKALTLALSSLRETANRYKRRFKP